MLNRVDRELASEAENSPNEPEPRKTASKTFVDALNHIADKVFESTSNTAGALEYDSHAESERIRRKHIARQPGGDPAWQEYCEVSRDNQLMLCFLF